MSQTQQMKTQQEDKYSGTVFWQSMYEQQYFPFKYAQGGRYVDNVNNKYKLRLTEPVMTDYGKSKEIDEYVQRLTFFKEKYPEHIIFRNKNLSQDINVEIAKIDKSLVPLTSVRGHAYVTRSPFSPTMKRIPPLNIQGS